MKTFRLMLLCAATVSADCALANITGSDLQNFNATTNGLDFITVQSSETLAPGIFNFGFFANYAVNTLPRYELDANSSRTSNISDSILAADLNMGFGLANNWDVGISIPQVVYQDVNLEGEHGEFGQNGITEIRANTKFRVLGDRNGGVALVLSANQNITKNNPYVGEGGGPTLNFEIAMDTTLFDKLALGLNVGYRKRQPGKQIPDFPIAPLEDQFLASLAASYLFTSIDTKVIFEFYNGFPTKDSETVASRQAKSSEFLLGLKHDLTDQLAIHGGVGTEASNGTASADWRVYVGVNYAFGFEERKKEVQFVRAPQRPAPKRAVAAPPPPPPPKFVDEGPAELPGPGDEVFVLRGVNFAFDSASRVLPGTRDILAKLAEHLRKTGFEKIIIEGHTDSVGSTEYNQTLGQSRANTIKDYLVRQSKFDGSRLEAVSYGETKPVADNGNYQGRQLNRRVVFRLFYDKSKRP